MYAVIHRVFMAAAAGLALGGCAALGSTDQASAGLTIAEVEWCRLPDRDEPPFICALRLRDGKEKDSVALSLKHPAGMEVSYAANGVKAFDAITARADVEKALASAGVDVTPSVVDLIMKVAAGR